MYSINKILQDLLRGCLQKINKILLVHPKIIQVNFFVLVYKSYTYLNQRRKRPYAGNLTTPTHSLPRLAKD